MMRSHLSSLTRLAVAALLASSALACVESSSTGSSELSIESAEVGLVFDEAATLGDEATTTREASVVVEIDDAGVGRRELGATDAAGNATRIEISVQVGEEPGRR